MKSDGLGVKRPYLYCTLWPHRRTSRPRVMETTKKVNGPFRESVICRLPELMRGREE
jgi:hypothetical protein